MMMKVRGTNGGVLWLFVSGQETCHQDKYRVLFPSKSKISHQNFIFLKGSFISRSLFILKGERQFRPSTYDQSKAQQVERKIKTDMTALSILSLLVRC